MKTKTKKKQKRSYKKDTVKRIAYTLATDAKHLSKMVVKLQKDVENLRQMAKSK